MKHSLRRRFSCGAKDRFPIRPKVVGPICNSAPKQHACDCSPDASACVCATLLSLRRIAIAARVIENVGAYMTIVGNITYPGALLAWKFPRRTKSLKVVCDPLGRKMPSCVACSYPRLHLERRSPRHIISPLAALCLPNHQA